MRTALFLKMVHDTGKIGRVAMKPTQAMEDGINAGIHSWMLQGTKFEVGRKYAVDGYVEHKEAVDAIVKLLPATSKTAWRTGVAALSSTSLTPTTAFCCGI